MSGVQRYLRLLLGSLTAALGAIVVLELVELALPEAAAISPRASDANPSAPAEAAPASEPDLDALVRLILARPLFAPGRRPPAPPPVTNADNDKEEVKPPDLEGRLAGTVITPDRREALFAREGERPLAVTEGEAVDGWTVRTIEPDRVVLMSDFGEKIIEPAPGVRGEGVVPTPPKKTAAAQVKRANAPTRTAPPLPRPRKAPGQVGLVPNHDLSSQSISRTAQNSP